MSMKNMIEKTILDSIQVKKELALSQIPLIESAGDLLAESLKNGKKLLICGNGGSSCDASHIAAELLIRYKSGNERPALPVICLNSDSAVLTAGANDYGYDAVFARQVSAFGNPGDVLIGITTSGNSKNILLAIEEAKKKNMKIVALLGGNGGKVKSLCDIEIIVPSTITARIQESHILVGHILCAIVEKKLFSLD